MTTALTFQSTTFDVVDRNNQPWVRSPQIGDALGYTKGRRSIAKIYEVHADEFTDAMTAVVKLPTEGGEQDVRIFSLRGCHLLAMFARTKVAKEFRKWVLDVLDSLDKEHQPEPQPSLPPTDAPITPDQQCTLQALVKARIEAIPEAERPKGLYPQIWNRFKNHFRVAKYSQLPQTRMSEAVEYLTKMELRTVKPATAAKSEEKTEDRALPQSNTVPPADIPPVPECDPDRFKILRDAQRACRDEIYNLEYRRGDVDSIRRAHVCLDLYKAQSALWGALFDVYSAVARTQAWESESRARR